MLSAAAKLTDPFHLLLLCVLWLIAKNNYTARFCTKGITSCKQRRLHCKLAKSLLFSCLDINTANKN